jgi:hypothetical protein
LCFTANVDAILPSVDVDTLLENRGPTAVTWGAAAVDSSKKSEGASEGADSPGRADPLLMVKFHQPSHEFTFGVGMNFISYPLVITPLV